MTELHIENRKSICKIIWNAIINFFKSMFTTKKFVIKSHCKDSCCCRNCGLVVAYDEKEEDDSGDDIVITDEDVKIR